MKQEDIQDLKELIEFLKQHGVAEFDVDRGDLKIRLKFNQPQGASPSLSDLARAWATAPQPAAPSAYAPTAPTSVPHAQTAAAPEPKEDLHIVKSPIVGTF